MTNLTDPSRTPGPYGSSSSRRDFLMQSSALAAALASSGVISLDALASSMIPRELIGVDGPVKVGVIGVGRQGRAILAELQKIENLTIAALCDTDPSRLESAKRRVPAARTFADHKAMLDSAPDIKAYIVATPTHLHKDVVLDCLAHACDVYCEGPLAASIDDCRAMVNAARDSGRTCQVGMQARSDPIYKLSHTFMVAGSVRDVVSARAQMHRKTSWRNPSPDASLEYERNWNLDPERSCGLVGEFGTHQFDVIHWFLNRYPVKVRGAGSIRFYNDGRKAFDTIDCEFTFDDGVRFYYDATIANSYEGQYEAINGSMGTMRLAWTHGWLFKEADAPTQGWEVYANRQQFYDDQGITLIADATKLAAQGKLKEGVGLTNSPLYFALKDFITCVNDRTPPPCSFGEGLRAAAVGILAHQAIRTGEEITVDRDLFREA